MEPIDPMEQKLPITNSQKAQFYPYFFALADTDTTYRNTVMALNARGFFSQANGFAKLGFIYGSCFPQIPPEYLAWLHQVGVPASQIVTYDVGCPAAFGSPGAPQFWLGQGPAPGPVHFAFRAPNRASVQRFHKAALAAGGKDNGAPGIRASYGENYYAAFVIDPDGHNVEAVCLRPE